MSDSTAEQTRIEEDLQQTRARMDSRLSELQERLSPGQVLDDLMKYFRGSEGADFGRNLLASVQGNPLPAALTGIGVAWLMATNARTGATSTASATTATASKMGVSSTSVSSNWPHPDDLELRVRQAEQSVVRDTDESEDIYGNRLDDARGKALGIAREAQDTASSFSQRIQDGLASAKQSASQGAQSLQNKASGAASTLSGSAERVGDQIGQGAQAAGQMSANLLSTITENPVVLGAIGLAVGALLGAIVPQSEQEEAALGGVAGQVRKTARDAVQTAMDSGGQIAQQVMQAGRDSAQAQGLTSDKSVGEVVEGLKSGELAGSAKQVAQDVLQAGDAALRKQGGGPGQPASEPATPNPSSSAPVPPTATGLPPSKPT